MDKALARALGMPVAPANQHEWDAALSAYTALEGLTGRSKQDSLPTVEGERIVCPCGATRYCWPD